MQTKFAILLLLTIGATFAHVDQLTFLGDKDIFEFKLYSMVWSAKEYPRGAEKKTFFYAIPFTFLTTMTVDKAAKKLHIKFNNAKAEKGMFASVKKEMALAEQSLWKDMLSFNGDHTEVSVNLDFSSGQYAIQIVREYGNTTFQSVQVKFVLAHSKVQRALYITFDIPIKETPVLYSLSFYNFMNSLKTLPK